MDFNKSFEDLDKSIQEVDELVKSIKNKSQLVAVKRAVKRKDGKTFQQTFYVSPEEAKEMMSGKKTTVKEENKSYSSKEYNPYSSFHTPFLRQEKITLTNKLSKVSRQGEGGFQLRKQLSERLEQVDKELKTRKEGDRTPSIELVRQTPTESLEKQAKQLKSFISFISDSAKYDQDDQNMAVNYQSLLKKIEGELEKRKPAEDKKEDKPSGKNNSVLKQIEDKLRTLPFRSEQPGRREGDFTEMENGGISASWRVSKYFEYDPVDREDKFTGYKEVKKIVDEHFKDTKGNFDISIEPSEKGWFEVQISPKKSETSNKPSEKKAQEPKQEPKDSKSNTLGTGQPMSKEDSKQAVTDLKNKLGVAGVIKFAEENGVTWTRNEKHVGNDYMQLAMKLTKHLREGKQFTSGETKQEQNKKESTTDKKTPQMRKIRIDGDYDVDYDDAADLVYGEAENYSTKAFKTFLENAMGKTFKTHEAALNAAIRLVARGGTIDGEIDESDEGETWMEEKDRKEKERESKKRKTKG